MGQRRDLGFVGEVRTGQNVIGYLRCGRRSEECSYVDGHVEEAKCSVALAAELRIVVEIAHHDLEIALEQARPAGDESQRTEHHGLAGDVSSGGDGQQRIAQKHDDDARCHHLAVAETVGKDSADEGHEINKAEETSEDSGCFCRGVTELGLQKQSENGKHGVVTETLARIG